MEYRTLGRTGIRVSTYALGTMMFGADGNSDEKQCIDIIHAALDSGIKSAAGRVREGSASG